MFTSEWWLGLVTGAALMFLVLVFVAITITRHANERKRRSAEHFEVEATGHHYRTRTIGADGSVGPWSAWITPGDDDAESG